MDPSVKGFLKLLGSLKFDRFENKVEPLGMSCLGDKVRLNKEVSMKTVTAFDIAEYFIYLSDRNKRGISNKKLQKVVYYAQAWFLVLAGRLLFPDKIEAWIHGPAIPELYRKYKKFGFSPISSQNANFDPAKLFDRETLGILDEVWDVYGKYDADYLEVLTHEEDPWINARNALEFSESSTNEISTDILKDFYTQKLHDQENKEQD